MAFLGYLVATTAAFFIAVLASTVILRIPFFSWVFSNYGWSEIAINGFAFLAGAYLGLASANWLFRKLAARALGRIAVWVIGMPFVLLGVAEIALNRNFMGLAGAVGALVGIYVFRQVQTDQSLAAEII